MSMLPPQSPRTISDDTALEEAYAAIQSSLAFGVINIESDFLDLCRCYDRLLGKSSSLSTTTAIVNDRSRNWYLYLTSNLLHETRFTITELNIVAHELLDARDNNKREKTHTKQRMDAPALQVALLEFCRRCSFEPKWHMEKRGDTKPLPSNKGKNLWGYLRNLYVDPEYSRLRTPDYVTQYGSSWPGYMELVKAAIADGHARLKEIYGEDVDLSPVNDLKEKTDVDYDGIGASFVGLLRSKRTE